MGKVLESNEDRLSSL